MISRARARFAICHIGIDICHVRIDWTVTCAAGPRSRCGSRACQGPAPGRRTAVELLEQSTAVRNICCFTVAVGESSLKVWVMAAIGAGHLGAARRSWFRALAALPAIPRNRRSRKIRCVGDADAVVAGVNGAIGDSAESPDEASRGHPGVAGAHGPARLLPSSISARSE